MSLKDERFPKVMGVFALFLSAYLLVAFTSYLFTWKEDYDKAYWSLLISTENVHVANWLGRFGAVISKMAFAYGFGISSFYWVYLAFKTGKDMINGKPFKSLFPVYRQYFITMLWTSFVLAFFFQSLDFPVGGAWGGYLVGILMSMVGAPGVILMMFLVGMLLLIWVKNPNFKELKAQGVWATLRSLPPVQFVLNLSLRRALKMRRAAPPVEAEAETSQAETTEAVVPNSSGGLDLVIQTAPEEEGGEEEPQEQKKPSQDEGSQELQIPNREELEKRFQRLTGGQLILNLPELSEEEQRRLEEEAYEEEAPLQIEISQNGTGAGDDLSVTAENKEHFEPYDPTLDLPRFENPVLDLLEAYDEHKPMIDRVELETNKDQIIETLLNYKIEIVSIKATVGPTVTLYEIVPAPGIRISKIKSLEDDIALSLAALGIRIIAPIPGKGTIGIEVPNRNKQVVSLKEVLASPKFRQAKMDLPIALGKTISNEVLVADLAKMPHLLIAGATGQGKSVGINTIIMSLLYKKHPSQIKLILIDPKKVELSLYNRLANHYLGFLPGEEEAIVTDTSKVVQTLHSLTVEMDERYNLLKKAGVRNITEYNQKFVQRRLNPEKGHRFLPYIVIIIDEFADMIMTAGKEVELPIGRLAQLARAVGIHLIIATQRPSVNIITGVIKANFPARLAFRVASKIDSRTILDTGGAEQLIGRGDMLLSTGSDTIRIQCAFVDTDEVERVIDHIANQKGYPEPFYLPAYGEDGDGEQQFNQTLAELDEFFEDAARLIVATQQGSTSMIQRRLKLGYNRAGRIMDQLEAIGIVGGNEGSKARQVHIQDEIELEDFLRNLRDKRTKMGLK